MVQHGPKPPIFILGVPRSGTTLLRTILDSHPAIACGPETPWLGGHQPRSVMELWRFLREDKHGYAASYAMPKELVTGASRAFVERLLGEYARTRGKSRWAEKTPDNALYVDFLAELFPEGRFIHLVRDGLDVAMSTCVVEEHRKGISGFLERHLGLGPGVPHVENSLFNALLKWNHWNRLIEHALAGRDHFRLTYERLVTEPEATTRALMDYIGEPFQASMLDYAAFPHEYPAWEWGSADVKARARITGDRVGRARRELPALQRDILEPLTGIAAGGVGARSVNRASLGESDERLTLLAKYIAGFARPLGLDADPESTRVTAWLWLHGLSHIDWPRSRLLGVECGLSPLPWIAAMLGAQVRLAAAREPEAKMTGLRDKLRVGIEWRVGTLTGSTANEAWADAALVGNIGGAAPLVASAVKPGGIIAAVAPPADLADALGSPRTSGDTAAAIMIRAGAVSSAAGTDA